MYQGEALDTAHQETKGIGYRLCRVGEESFYVSKRLQKFFTYNKIIIHVKRASVEEEKLNFSSNAVM